MREALPTVSIVTISYNQERYIKQALESFVTQHTDFIFEIIVADDASTDGTQEVIREYERNYPQIFRNILREKNVGAQRNFKEAMVSARGRYVALCEGDDFWTDSTKLQRQVDFLDKHDTYSMCFHPVRVFYEDGTSKEEIYPSEKRAFTLEELLHQNFIQTNSVMYRRLKYDTLPVNILPLDWYLHLFHARTGRIGYIDRVMSSYRRHSGGMWWGSQSKHRDEFWLRHGQAHFALMAELLRLFEGDKKSRSIVHLSLFWMFQTLTRIDRKYQQDIVSQVIMKYPEVAEPYILKLQDMQGEERAVLRSHQEHIKFLEESVQQKNNLITELSLPLRVLIWRKLKSQLKLR